MLLLHWWFEDQAFVARLREHGFRVVVLSRHPLDVLISILVYSQHDHSTLQWLDGAAGNERGILGASPLGEAFLSYATGPHQGAFWASVPQLVASAGLPSPLRRPCGRHRRTAAAHSGRIRHNGRKPIAEVVKQAAPQEIEIARSIGCTTCGRPGLACGGNC